MKRLIVGIVTAAVVGGMLGATPAVASSWDFPSASFTVDDGSGTQATITVQNLRITDGTTARGYLRLDGAGASCSSSAFTGLDAYFFIGSYEPCSGTVSFSVDSAGALAVSTALVVKGHVFGGPVTGSSQGTKYPPALTCTATPVGSDGASVTISDPGGQASSFLATAKAGGLPDVTGMVNPPTSTVQLTGLAPGTTYTISAAAQPTGVASDGACTVTTPAPAGPIGYVSYGGISVDSSKQRWVDYTLNVTGIPPATPPNGYAVSWIFKDTGSDAGTSGVIACGGVYAVIPRWVNGSTTVAGADVPLIGDCDVQTPKPVSGTISGNTVTVNYEFPAQVAYGTQVFARYSLDIGPTQLDVPLGAAPTSGTGSASFTAPSLRPGVGVWVKLFATNGAKTSPVSTPPLHIKASTVIPPFTVTYGQSTINALVGATIPADVPVIKPTTTGPFAYVKGGGTLPSGVTLDPKTGVIAGVAATAATHQQAAIGAKDSTGHIEYTILTFNFTVLPAGGVASARYPDIASAPIGVALSVLPNSAASGETFTLDAASTAAGMRINATTGEVNWTPAAPVGPRTVVVTVTANGTSAPLAPFTITVTPVPPTTAQAGASNASSASSGGATTGTGGGSSGSGGSGAGANPCLAPNGSLYVDFAGSAGSTLTMAPNTFGMPIPTSFVVTKGSLPRGVWLDGVAGVISGTPERSNGGNGAVEITTTWPDGTVRATDFNIAIDDPHHAVNYANRIIGSVGQPISVTPFSVNAQGARRFELVCGTLPAGMTMNTRTGVISGTPATLDERPMPLRVRMTDAYGWVDASLLFVVDPGLTTWMRYPEFAEIGTGSVVRIVPTRSGLSSASTFAIVGDLPKGLSLNKRTGVISGRAVVRDGYVYEPTVTAFGVDGKPQASTVPSMTVIKPAVPMKVTARPAKKSLKQGKSTLVAKVKHPPYVMLSAKVACSKCSYTFSKKTGKVVVTLRKGASKVTVTIIGQPKTSATRAAYAGHTWTRAWAVAGRDK